MIDVAASVAGTAIGALAAAVGAEGASMVARAAIWQTVIGAGAAGRRGEPTGGTVWASWKTEEA